MGWRVIAEPPGIAAKKMRRIDDEDAEDYVIEGPIALATASRAVRVELATQIELLCAQLLQRVRLRKDGVTKAKAAVGGKP